VIEFLKFYDGVATIIRPRSWAVHLERSHTNTWVKIWNRSG